MPTNEQWQAAFCPDGQSEFTIKNRLFEISTWASGPDSRGISQRIEETLNKVMAKGDTCQFSHHEFNQTADDPHIRKVWAAYQAAKTAHETPRTNEQKKFDQWSICLNELEHMDGGA